MKNTDLQPWNDPDLILEALYQVPRERQHALEAAISPLLSHDDPDIREEALRILVTRWKDAAYRHKTAQMLISDPAPTVRGAAAYALTAISDEFTKSEHTALLLNTLLDESEEPNVRGAAYDALLILHRRQAFPTKQREFDPELDVDWAWVRSL